MNVIFRGNGKRKAERAGRGCTCRGGLQLSSHPLCTERETDTEKRGKEAAAAASFGERVHSRSQRWERKERKAMESKSATSSSPKGPLLRLPFALTRIA